MEGLDCGWSMVCGLLNSRVAGLRTQRDWSRETFVRHWSGPGNEIDTVTQTNSKNPQL